MWVLNLRPARRAREVVRNTPLLAAGIGWPGGDSLLKHQVVRASRQDALEEYLRPQGLAGTTRSILPGHSARRRSRNANPASDTKQRINAIRTPSKRDVRMPLLVAYSAFVVVDQVLLRFPITKRNDRFQRQPQANALYVPGRQLANKSTHPRKRRGSMLLGQI